MKRFPFQNPVNQSWEEDSETVIYGDDLLEDVAPEIDDDLDTLPYNHRVLSFEETSYEATASDFDEDYVDEYLSQDALKEADPSAPSFSRPTFDGPLVSGQNFLPPAASRPAYAEDSYNENPLRRSSIPPAPLPLLQSRPPVPPQRAEMPTPVMDILPSMEAIRPESRPPAPHQQSYVHDVRIPQASAVPQNFDGYSPTRSAPPLPPHLRGRRANSHLDTLRPYATSTSPSSLSPRVPAEPSVWLAAFGERLNAALSYSADAAREAIDWAVEMWSEVDSSYPGNAVSRFVRRTTTVARDIGDGVFGVLGRLPWRGAAEVGSSLISLRTATWSLGVAFVALAVIAIRAPLPGKSPAGVSQATANPPIMLDADAIARPEPMTQEPDTDKGTDDIEESARDSLLARASQGDKKAISTLEEKEPTSLSLDEVTALALGQEALARKKTTRIISAIAKKRRLSETDRATFIRHATNHRTYREALLAMAENKSWQGPDLIYQVMRRYRSQKDIAQFAHALLLTPKIYKYASPALTVVIDAESISEVPTSSSECQQVRGIAERAYEDGDSRAVHHMARFANTSGCGKDGSEDCFPCLREDDILVDALRASKSRRPPL